MQPARRRRAERVGGDSPKSQNRVFAQVLNNSRQRSSVCEREKRPGHYEKRSSGRFSF